MTAQPHPIGTPYQLAGDQIREALEATEIPYEQFAAPPWKQLAEATGPYLPGAIWVIGARINQGKTTFLLHCFSALYREHRKVLYIATETPPEVLRRQLTAMHCDLDKTEVLRNRWHKASPVLSAEEVKEVVQKDLRDQDWWREYGEFFHAAKLDRDALNAAYKQAKRLKAEVIILDHVNEYRRGSGSVQEYEALASDLAAMAGHSGMSVLLAQQITPSREHVNSLSEFVQPALSTLKGSQAFAEKARLVIMLHRARKDLPREEAAELMRLIAIGQRQSKDILDPGIMCASIAKDRDGPSLGRTLRLRVYHTGWVSEDP